MERGHGRTLCAVWGGIALGVGTLLFALCSPSSVSCATNLVVLTHATVTARSCAAFSVVARVGIGLMVLGAVLLTGAFVLSVRQRRQNAADAVATTATVATTLAGRAPGSVSPPSEEMPADSGELSEAPGTSEAPGPGYPDVDRRRARPPTADAGGPHPSRRGERLGARSDAAPARLVRQSGQPRRSRPVVGRDQAHRPAPLNSPPTDLTDRPASPTDRPHRSRDRAKRRPR